MTTQAQAISTVHITHDVSIEPIFYRDQPVLTLAMIDRVHARPEGTARRNFATNKSKLIDGEDFYLIDFAQKNEIRSFGIEVPPRGLILLTESGYLMLVKSFTDDLAWTVQRQLVKGYFRAKAEAQPTPVPTRLSHEEYARLTHAVTYAVQGIRIRQAAENAVYNRLRIHFNLRALQELPSAKLEEALVLVNSFNQPVSDFIHLVRVMENQFIRDVLNGGEPFTAHLSRLWHRKIGTQIPASPNWRKIAQQLQQAA